MLKKHFSNILLISFLASVFLLTLIKIEDPDVWIHLSFGRLIWNLKGLPPTDPFLYTMQGQPLFYSSWLFGLIYYAAYHAFNVYGVILLKAITITTAFYVLLRDALRPHKNVVVAIIVMSLVVVMVRHRFAERPDSFTMIFLSFSIFSLNAFIYDGKKYLFALPFVHMLWANSHSSIPLMLVPFAAFIAGGFFQHYVAGISPRFMSVPSLPQIKTITLVWVASFVASLISPYFINQYFFGSQLLASSNWYKLNIAELRPPTWQTMKWPFIVAPAVILSFTLNRRRIQLIDLLLVTPFIVLSFTAHRFAFLPCIVAGPIITRNITAALQETVWWERFSSKTFVFASVTVWIILYVSLVYGRVEPFVDPHVVDAKTFGFGINHDLSPEGALRYMDKRNIRGRMFNYYTWGQYIIWRDYPTREAFIDGRGYLPRDLLEIINQAPYQPEILDYLHNKYGFESILINYPDSRAAFFNFGNIQALSHPGWALVYWDDLSLLYLKKGGRFDTVIKEDEYRYINPANDILSVRSMIQSEEGQTHLLEELERNIKETGSSKAYAFLGSIYNGMGLYQEAIEAFSHVRAFPMSPTNLSDRYGGIGYAYSQLGNLDAAMRIYKEALDLTLVPDQICFNIGKIYLITGDKKNAINYLEKALKINSNLVSAYPLLISLYYEMNKPDDAKRLDERYKRALIVKGGEEHNDLGRKAYAARDVSIAIEEFKKSIEINPSNPAAYSNLGRVYFDLNMLSEALQCQTTALEIDPHYAVSHYWIALIYRNWGNSAMARKHFKEYLRIEPAGYFSKSARENIVAVDTM